MDDLRETVARAICEAERRLGWDALDPDGELEYRRMAAAALAAIEASGHRIVPVEPTEEMVEAGEEHTDNYYSEEGDFLRGYKAALTAYGQKGE